MFVAYESHYLSIMLIKRSSYFKPHVSYWTNLSLEWMIVFAQASVVVTPSSNPAAVPCTTTEQEPPRKRWKFLTAKQLAGVAPVDNTVNIAQAELSKYLIEIRNSPPVSDSLNFWLQRRCIYPQLASLAEDLLCAPASQAFVERIFSLCGLLSAGRRNRMHKSLEMRVFLKLNAHLL